MSAIPKIIHCCWFGPNPFPQSFKQNIETWKKYCPDYEIKIWTEDNIDVNVSKYLKSARNHKKWAFMSDYVRLYVLYKYGGIYLDTDVELIKSLDPLLNNEMFTGLEEADSIATGLILGSIKKNQTIRKLLSLYDSRGDNIVNGQFVESTCVEITTKFFFENGFEYVNKNQKVLNCQIFSTRYFCPQRPGSYKIRIRPETYTIHHYSASWFQEKGIKKRVKYRSIYYKYLLRRFLVKIVGINNMENLRSWYRNLKRTK
ncbi:MAG TPA: glycosyltransferase [Enterococcus sp.]|nr:glycosyltransferase [Enterococcus sp.]